MQLRSASPPPQRKKPSPQPQSKEPSPPSAEEGRDSAKSSDLIKRKRAPAQSPVAATGDDATLREFLNLLNKIVVLDEEALNVAAEGTKDVTSPQKTKKRKLMKGIVTAREEKGKDGTDAMVVMPVAS
ncbi:hypothetical protein Dimus_011061, partial [Dionaea muscipula]